MTVAAVFVAATPWNMIVNYPMLAPAVAVLAIALCVCLEVESVAILVASGASLMFLMFFATGVSVLAHPASAYVALHPVGIPSPIILGERGKIG